MSFTRKILVAMAAGIIVGWLLGEYGGGTPFVDDFLVGGVFAVVGRIFLSLLQMMVVPLVLLSLVTGVTSLGDVRALGRLATKTLALYCMTTVIALVLVLSVAVLAGPGEGFEMRADVSYEPRTAPGVVDVLVGLVPTNPIRALADGEMLQIISFALLLGFAMSVTGATGRRVAALFADMNAVVMRMVMIVIRAAPLGVFALLARTFAAEGLELIVPLASYLAVVVVALALQVAIVYTTLLRIGGLRAAAFFSKLREVMTFAFSTSSSSATIPVTLTTLERRHGVSNSVAAFTVPLGATINMDGTAIMQGAATVFIANVYGVDLGLGDFVAVILTATLASVGTAGVPGAGLVMLAMVLQQVGLPVEGIALIIGIERLVDMLRTAVNVTGDCVVAAVVARSEGELDLAVFNDPDAGDERGTASIPPRPEPTAGA